MKQQQLHKLATAFKLGFYGGASLSFLVYVFARVLFYEFTFTAWEEVSNFFIIVVTGGILVGAALFSFLSLEMTLGFLSSLTAKRINYNDEVAAGSLEDMKTAA